MKFFALTVICFFWLNGQVFSQNKFEADAGFGLFEALSVKVKYGNNFQVGIGQGFFQMSAWVTGIEGYYHFAGVSKFTDQKTFYLMGGVAATLFAGGYSAFEKIIIYPRIGRSFNFSAKTGLNIDIGEGILMADDIDGYHAYFTPTFGVHFFVRL